MPLDVEVTLATPEEHKYFIERMPEFELIDGAASCSTLGNAVIVNLGAEQDIFGGACYFPGEQILTRAAAIHLFGIFPEHRPVGVESAALKSLEEELTKNGMHVALATLSSDGFRGLFQRAGYAPVGNSGYYMRALVQ